MAEHDIKYTVVETLGKNRAVVAIEPLEQGYGHTLGNALRRVMLGHLSGAAITRVKIDGVAHEFSALTGVHEDVVQIIQNLKLIDFKMTNPKVTIVTLDASGESEVTAGSLRCPTGVEVVNKDLHVATLSDKKSKLKMELTVEYGKGYQLPVEQDKKAVGVIMIDANFSPVVMVSYKIETARVGRVTDLDRLVMDITTNGSLSPKEAIQQAAAILAEYFSLLAGDTQVYIANVEVAADTAESAGTGKTVYLEEMGLPTRVMNTLKKAGYETVADLSGVSEDDLGQVKNIGPKTAKMLLKKINNANA